VAVAFANQAAAVSTTGAWQDWNLQYVLSNSGTTICYTYAAEPNPWDYWNNAYVSGNYTYTTGGTIGYPSWETWNVRYEETAEQRANRERDHAEIRARQVAEHERLYAADRARQAVVNSRAEQLLMSLLNDEQRRTRREHGWFEVRGSLGGRWRIRNQGQSGNVDLMPQDGDVRLMSFCIHPPDRLPDADAHVAQMLGIVTDELAFRRTGNVTYQRADIPRDVDRATIGLPVLASVPEPAPLVLGQQNRGPSVERARRRRNEHRRLVAA
jgi:hypothetical protein